MMTLKLIPASIVCFFLSALSGIALRDMAYSFGFMRPLYYVDQNVYLDSQLMPPDVVTKLREAAPLYFDGPRPEAAMVMPLKKRPS